MVKAREKPTNWLPPRTLAERAKQHQPPFYRWWITLFDQDTKGLSPFHCFVYRAILDIAWVNGASLPDDEPWIARAVAGGRPDVMKLIMPALVDVIDEFFVQAHGRLFNKRLWIEFERVMRSSQAQSDRVKVRWEKHGAKQRAANHRIEPAGEQRKSSPKPSRSAPARGLERGNSALIVHSEKPNGANALYTTVIQTKTKKEESIQLVSTTEPLSETPRTASTTEDSETAKNREPALWSIVPDDGDWGKPLFREGIAYLARLSGQSPGQLRPLVGRWLKLLGGNHKPLYEYLAQAERQNVADPRSWVSAAISRFIAEGGTHAEGAGRDDHQERSNLRRNAFAKRIAGGFGRGD